jgi:Protein of unknown function (DUF3037)
VPDRKPFQYTILRLVPRIERGECVNVGVVVFCRQEVFLCARIGLDESRIRALAPDLDLAGVRAPLDAIQAVIDGAPEAGRLGRLDQSERFGWVAARSSTVIQASDVHTGMTDDPLATLEHLYSTLVQTG